MMDYSMFSYYHGDSDDDNPSPRSPPLCSAERWFTNFDAKGLAQEIVESIPSLERVNMDVGPVFTPNPQAFVRKEGGVEMVSSVGHHPLVEFT